LTDNSLREQHELDLQVALGPALIATKGYSAPAVGETLGRARALAERSGRTDYIVPLLYNQYTFHGIRSEPELALSCAEMMERLGERNNDALTLLVGHLYHGLSYYTMGEFSQARSLLEQCHGL